MVKDFEIVSSLPRDKLLEAFRSTFTERARFSLSPKKSLQRQLKWKEVRIAEDHDCAVEVVDTGLSELLTAPKVGSIRGSQIAIKIEPSGDRLAAHLWTPRYKTYSVFAVNQFQRTFSIFAHLMFEKVHTIDSNATLSRM